MAFATNLEVSIPMELRRSLQKASRRKERHPILAALLIVLPAAWLLGVLTSTTAGGLVHLLPVAALIVLAIRVLGGRTGI